MRRATIQASAGHRPAPPVGAPGLLLGGKYRLEEAIARGGMARVWRAIHVTLDRPVAVKFVEAMGATPDERTERFLREAKVAASVRHKNVVDILDFGLVSSRDGSEAEPYMVMELLEGETLDQRMARASMTAEESVDVALQMLSGLDAVHRVGIVHRDLKPGNVFLTLDNDGVFARLLDFGISQDAAQVAGTQDGMVVGTPEYMSPEQAFGDPSDARSDLYAVGVVLYEMLSGVLPFEADEPQAVIELVAHGTVLPLSVLRPDLPALCEVVARAMAREPSERFETARDMRRAILESIGGGPDTTGRHSIVRDSRISGMQPRAGTPRTAATLEAEPSSRPDIEMVPTPSPLPRAALALGALALVVVTAAIVWAATTMSADVEATAPSSGAPAISTAPAASDPAQDLPRAAEAAAVGSSGATPPSDPELGEAAQPTAPSEAVDPMLEPQPGGEPEPVRARPRSARERQGGIVRELDF